MSASTAEGVIRYSRGRDKYDAHPEQLAAPSFEAFAEVVLSDRSTAKGLTWISASFKANSDGRNHRCRDGALPPGFLAFDLDGATPDAFAGLCMLLGAYSGLGYTTASHTTESPHARYILELSRPLGEAMQRQIEARLGLGMVKLDPSVYRGEQPIFAPLQNAETMRYHGDPVAVDAVLATTPTEPVRERPTTVDPYRALLIERGLLLWELGPGKDAITCPFAGDHSEVTSDTSTVYLWPHHGDTSGGIFTCRGSFQRASPSWAVSQRPARAGWRSIWRSRSGLAGAPLALSRSRLGLCCNLALEDTKRRLTKRLRILCGDTTPPPQQIELLADCPRLGSGGEEVLRAWLRDHPTARLVVIDTLPRFRPPTNAKETLYANDTWLVNTSADCA